MSVCNLAHISQQLIAHGRPAETPVAVIEWGTTVNQRTITGPLATIVDIVEREGFNNPSMVLVGEVVKLRDKIQWYETLLAQQVSAVEV